MSRLTYLKKTFDFYALLATQFFLRRRLISRPGAQGCAPRSVTVLTALTIHLFKVEKLSVAFLRVSQRVFWLKRFLCCLALFSAI